MQLGKQKHNQSFHSQKENMRILTGVSRHLQLSGKQYEFHYTYGGLEKRPIFQSGS